MMDCTIGKGRGPDLVDDAVEGAAFDELHHEEEQVAPLPSRRRWGMMCG